LIAQAPAIMKPTARRALAVLWPAFLGAGVLEMLVFAHVDPAALHDMSGQRLDLDPTAVYSLAFLAFWIVIGAACVMTQLLDLTSTEVNSRVPPG
jgi:hypothetical protein